MIKLSNILNEIRVNKAVPNNLEKLLSLKSQIQNSNDPKVKQGLALKCAELVLPIWNFYYPNDNTVRNCIETVKKFLKGEASVEEVKKAAEVVHDNMYNINTNDASFIAAFNAASTAAHASHTIYHTDDAGYADDTSYTAIEATKSFFKIDKNLKEIRVKSEKFSFKELFKSLKIKFPSLSITYSKELERIDMSVGPTIEVRGIIFSKDYNKKLMKRLFIWENDYNNFQIDSPRGSGSFNFKEVIEFVKNEYE